MSDSEDAKKANPWPLNPYFPFNPDNPIYPSWPSGLNMPLINHFNMPLSGAVQQSIADRVSDLEKFAARLETNTDNIQDNLNKIASNEKVVIKILGHLNSAGDVAEELARRIYEKDNTEGLSKEQRAFLIEDLKKEKKQLQLDGLEEEGFMDIFSEIRKDQIEEILKDLSSDDKKPLNSILDRIAGFQDEIRKLIKKLEQHQVLPEESLLDKLQDLKRHDKAAFQKVMKTIESEIKKAKG